MKFFPLEGNACAFTYMFLNFEICYLHVASAILLLLFRVVLLHFISKLFLFFFEGKQLLLIFPRPHNSAGTSMFILKRSGWLQETQAMIQKLCLTLLSSWKKLRSSAIKMDLFQMAKLIDR